MAPPRSPAVDIATRLLTQHGTSDVPTADDVAASAEHLFSQLFAGLSRWFGPFGSTALVGRALARAQVEHPSLASVTVAGTAPPSLSGFSDSVRTHGAKAGTDGILAILAALADLIGRLIGDDLALTLLEQSAQRPEAHGTVNGSVNGSFVAAESGNHARPIASPAATAQPVNDHD
jgi:hypothetical protein